MVRDVDVNPEVARRSTVSGYPGSDNPPPNYVQGRQYKASGITYDSQSSGRKLIHNVYASRGQSGSPHFMRADEGEHANHAFAIFNAGSAVTGVFTSIRLRTPMLNEITSWF